MRTFATALLLFVLAAPFSATAEEAWSGEMIDELMSPYCPGRTLRNCPSPQANELMEWIEGQEAEGRDRDTVYTQLLSEFGDEIRQAPEVTGFGLVAYAIPLLAAFVGGGIVFAFMRRQGAQAAAKADVAETTAVSPVDPEIERLIDEELGRSSK